MTLTPEQFNLLATKSDLNDLKDGMVTKEEFTEKFDQILTAVDNLTKEVRDFKVEMASNQMAHNRFQGEIDDLQVRTRRLELGAV